MNKKKITKKREAYGNCGPIQEGQVLADIREILLDIRDSLHPVEERCSQCKTEGNDGTCDRRDCIGSKPTEAGERECNCDRWKKVREIAVWVCPTHGTIDYPRIVYGDMKVTDRGLDEPILHLLPPPTAERRDGKAGCQYAQDEYDRGAAEASIVCNEVTVPQAVKAVKEGIVKNLRRKYQIIGSTGSCGNREQDKRNNENVIRINGYNEGISDALTSLENN